MDEKFIEVRKITRNSHEAGQGERGTMIISNESIRVDKIQTFRKWKASSEEKALLKDGEEILSVSVAVGRDGTRNEKIVESFDDFGKRVGTVFLDKVSG